MPCEIGPYNRILDFGKTHFILERVVDVVSVTGVTVVSVSDVCVGFFLEMPWASVAFLWIGFEGWLFSGLILLGPPAMGFSEELFGSRLT